MITILVQDCNRISQSVYDSVIHSLQLHQLTCTCGHSSCLSIHAYYHRSVKRPDGLTRLRICRVICSECQTTHALLPSSLVPYSQISLFDQHRICLCSESGECVNQICNENPSVDENNVKTVLRNYRKCWREKLHSLRIPLNPVLRLVKDCFLNYSSAFMQIHRMKHLLFLIPT